MNLVGVHTPTHPMQNKSPMLPMSHPDVARHIGSSVTMCSFHLSFIAELVCNDYLLLRLFIPNRITALRVLLN